MPTPQAANHFRRWLDEQIVDADTEAKKLRDDIREEGRRDGYADALRDVRAYFIGEQ